MKFTRPSGNVKPLNKPVHETNVFSESLCCSFRLVFKFEVFSIIFKHCVKSVQIRSYFWSVFSCFRIEYRKIQTRNNSVFRHFSCSENFDENTFFKYFFTISSYSFRIVLCFLKNLILNLSMKNWQNNVLKMSNSAFLWDKNPFGRYQLLFIISYKS